MEPEVGELQGPYVGSTKLLGLPEPCLWDSDDELLGIGGIKPKSSPIPRRRSSLSFSDDDESQPPPSSSRRVSFADAFGLSLVSVKQFDSRSMGDPVDPLEVDFKDVYFLKLLFALPLTLEEVLYRVQEQKVDLESLELLPGTTTLKGTVRVLNLCFDKLVYIRTSLDCWSSHFDLLAEFVPEASQGVTDCFSFKLTLVPPFGEQGARVDFCIRYETPLGTFWANNSGQNFVLFCHEKAKEQDENEKLIPKSCLKPNRHSSITSTTSNTEEIPEIILNCGIATVPEPVGVQEEKIQEDHMKLMQEENKRNCSRRSRRKAARMAKLQQYFVQSDDKDLQQTEKDADEVDAPVPAIDEAPLNLSTQQTNIASLLPESQGQKSIAGFLDVGRNQMPARQTQRQVKEIDSIPVIDPELITSKSQTRQPPSDSVNRHESVVDSQLGSSQDKETVTSQTASLKCQMSDKSIGKTVENAWERFEKCSMERMVSTADTNRSVHITNHEHDSVVETNQGSQSFRPHYTFETVVAPLYHQVFERMENDKRGIKNSASKVQESAGKLDDGSTRVVTYPSVSTRSTPEISAKHVNNYDYHGAYKKTFPDYLQNTPSAAENLLSVQNVETELALQDAASPDITDNLSVANIAELEPAQAVIQDSSDSQTSVSWEDSTIDQTEPTPEKMILQSKHTDDTEFSLDNTLPDTGSSIKTLNKEMICLDSTILPIQTEADIATVQPSPPTVSKNPQSTDKSVTQTSFEEINKSQDMEAQTSERTSNTLNTPMPDSSMFHSDISSNVTPKIIQSKAICRSPDLTQAIQPQDPTTVFFTQSLKATEATVSQARFTDDTNLIQEINLMCQDSERSPIVASEAESNPSERTEGVDSRTEIENNTETIQTDVLHRSPEETAVDRISENVIDVSQVCESKEHTVSNLNFDDEVNHFEEHLVTDMANTSNTESNSDYFDDATQEEDILVYNPDEKNDEQVLTDITGIQLEEAQDIKEVDKYLEEKEQQKDQVEKEEQESGEKTELGNKEKFNTGPYYTEEDEDAIKKTDKETDEEPRRNRVEREDEKEPEAEPDRLEMVSRVTSAATDSFIREGYLHLGQEQQNTSLEITSEEPVSEKHSIGGDEKNVCGIDSQQDWTLNTDVALSNQAKEVELIDRKEDMCPKIDKEHVAEDTLGEVGAVLEKQERDCLNEPSENMDDSASTESLTDDEMDLCLLRLRNTQQSGLKDGISMGKRHSISRISSPMPSISEYLDEDQTNEEMIELERATLPLLDKEEEVNEQNLLWWKEFFSNSMPKMIVYTILFVVFVITAYICDFIACFGLYLIALYWLYFQVQREPLKGT